MDKSLCEEKGSRSYPSFHPHVTLVASVPSPIPLSLIDDIFKTTARQAPIRLAFQRIEVGMHYYRSVYIAMEPSKEVTALHERIHKKLDIEPRTPAFPHLSLSYVEDEDDKSKDERQMCLKRLMGSGEIKQLEDSVEINVADDWVTGFIAMEAWVVDCNDLVETWTVLHKLSLHHS